MSTESNYCQDAGWVVGAEYAVAIAPFDFVWSSAGPILGCNQLHCRNCGAIVKQKPGFVAGAQAAAHCRELYEQDDWSEFLAQGVILEDPQRRLYVCHCEMHAEDFARPLGDTYAWDYGETTPPPWYCAGHPRLSLPTTIDQVPITPDTNFLALVQAAFIGTLPSTQPSFTRQYTAAWVHRLFFLLKHLDVGEAIAEAVAHCLTSESVQVRACAADFFRRTADVPGGDAIAPALHNHPDLYFGIPNPQHPEELLDHWMQMALAHRVALRDDSGTSVDKTAVSVAKQLVLEPRQPDTILIQALVNVDLAWMLENAEAIFRANPTDYVFRHLIYHLREPAGEQLVELLTRLIRLNVLDTENCLHTVQQMVPEPYRSEILILFHRSSN